MSLMRLLHTVRHLKGRQIAGQIAHRLRRLWDDPRRVLGWSAPPFPGVAWRPRREFLPPLQTQDAKTVLAGQLDFLNQPHALGWLPDWNNQSLPKLWQYNLQYFDYLWVLAFSDAKAVVCDWIDCHTPARGHAGWEPYPTSLRLMNWCCVFFAGTFRELVHQDEPLREKLWTSVYRQAKWLAAHRETHLLGNHLLENAAALSVVGSCFDGDEARRWLDAGIALLRGQLKEQILEDGGHFERSPMYHSRAVYVLSLLRNMGVAVIDELVSEPLSRASGALAKMCHPDGKIALLNDSAWGIYNEPAELAAYAGRDWPAAAGTFALPQTGYFGSRTADGSYLICDAGPIGPDHQPGHAHGDMLSFELSLRGHRVIVDSGVHDYERGEMRQYCRSTRAHNTVEIDGQDQCEFWGAFRVARRGHVRDVKWQPRGDGFELSAWHDGYHRLPGRPTHGRTFRWDDGGRLTLRDVLSGAGEHRFVSRLHLHPDCRVSELSAQRARVDYRAGAFEVVLSGDATLAIEDSIYCPEFGKRIPNQAMTISGRFDGQTELTVTIAPG